MRIADYIGIITGIFAGCIIFDLINGYFHKPFFRFGIYLAKIVKQYFNF